MKQIVIISIIAFVIGVCLGKTGMFEQYRMTKACTRCTNKVYDDIQTKYGSKKCLSDNTVCLNEYNATVKSECPNC